MRGSFAPGVGDWHIKEARKKLINAEQIKKKIRATGFRPKKRLGQTFLVDRWIFEIILAVAELQPDDHVLEIGAGFGRLTSRLAETGAQVTAIELDDFLYAELQSVCLDLPNVNMIHGDILKIDLGSLLDSKSGRRNKIVANLPYYIVSPILMKLLEFSSSIDTCVLMVQKEVADRIVASPGTKDYGVLTVEIDYHAEAEIIASVPAKFFYPTPEVDSALIKLTMRDSPKASVKNEELFSKVIRGAFQHRRKTLRNSLAASPVPLSKKELDDILEDLQIDRMRRGETLTVSEFAELANLIYHNLEKDKEDIEAMLEAAAAPKSEKTDYDEYRKKRLQRR